MPDDPDPDSPDNGSMPEGSSAIHITGVNVKLNFDQHPIWTFVTGSGDLHHNGGSGS